MIKQNTLLILGAGASVDYRFPLGSKLLWKVYDFLVVGSNEFCALREAGFSKPETQKFREALSCENTSIDSFLEYNKEFVDIGKTSIALALLPCEITENLFENAKDRERNWYQLLFNYLSENCPFDKFQDNKLRVITFNYDRSLEQFLYKKIQSKYNSESEDDCITKVKSIPIIHVHGRLGCLPWQKPEDKDEKEIEYDSYNSYNYKINKKGEPIIPSYAEINIKEYARIAVESSKSIKIIHHEVQSFDEKNVYNLINKAKYICFLGFGFHPTNLERLNITENFPNYASRITGTGYDFTAEQLKTIMQFGFIRLRDFLSGDRDNVRKIDIYNYLKYHRTFT